MLQKDERLIVKDNLISRKSLFMFSVNTKRFDSVFNSAFPSNFQACNQGHLVNY